MGRGMPPLSHDTNTLKFVGNANCLDHLALKKHDGVFYLKKGKPSLFINQYNEGVP
jgi:hypothetical protein